MRSVIAIYASGILCGTSEAGASSTPMDIDSADSSLHAAFVDFLDSLKAGMEVNSPPLTTLSQYNCFACQRAQTQTWRFQHSFDERFSAISRQIADIRGLAKPTFNTDWHLWYSRRAQR